MLERFAVLFQSSFRDARRVTGTVTLGVVVVAMGCSTADPPTPTPVAPTSSTTPDDSDAGPPPQRKLIQEDGIGTASTNLLIDPFFTAINGSRYTFYVDDPRSVSLSVDSRSPTGFGGRIAVLSSRASLVSAFAGGPGPFEAEVWVSKTDKDGNPLGDITVGDSGIRVAVTNHPDLADAAHTYDLTPSGASLVASNGRTWISLRARIEGSIDHMGFFLVQTSGEKGKYLVASPSVVAEPLAKAAPTRARSLVRAVPRVLRAEERAVIVRYMQQDERLDIPAAKRPPLPKAPRWEPDAR